MSVCLVLPLKSLSEGKTRLAPVLDADQRAALIDQLLMHTLAQAAHFPGLGHTMLVSACKEARARAKTYGASVLDEPVPGLNPALQHAQLTAYANGATKLLIVPCDLPLLTAEDLRCLADAASMQAIALAPDRCRQGTNGICLPTSIPFEFAFGPSSFDRHRSGIAQLQMIVAEVARPGLAFDVDTPRDLAQLKRDPASRLSLKHAVGNN
jgi:2-phospho-L-lactate guanylyltransferase